MKHVHDLVESSHVSRRYPASDRPAAITASASRVWERVIQQAGKFLIRKVSYMDL